MNKRRLLKLADMLEADAKNKKGIQFDLRTVGQASDYDPEAFEPGLNCGTTACAMGLAAISGTFKRAGLSYRIACGTEIDTTWKGRRLNYDIAAMRLFDITEDEANFLFTPSFYPVDMSREGAAGERMVAKRIRDFAAGKVKAEPEVA